MLMSTALHVFDSLVAQMSHQDLNLEDRHHTCGCSGPASASHLGDGAQEVASVHVLRAQHRALAHKRGAQELRSIQSSAAWGGAH